MPVLLRHRDEHLRERMDEPDCDPLKLANTYRQFRLANALFSRAQAVYSRWIRPRLADPDRRYTLLDIGCGGGDIPIRLAEWARQDGRSLAVTAIDPDPRAARFVATLERPPEVTFRRARPADLIAEGKTYDFVVSNHLVHHLETVELTTLLGEAQTLSRGRVVFVDLCRSDLAYALFAVVTLPLFRRSFIREDGLISIRRSYTRDELATLVPSEWCVEALAPFRLVLHHDRTADGDAAARR